MSELPPQVNAWLVIFIGIWLQAVPFLLLGTIISSTLTAFLKPQALARFLPRQTALAVVVAGLAGIALPACECASVPTTKSLVRAGVPTAAALTFMVASPHQSGRHSSHRGCLHRQSSDGCSAVHRRIVGRRPHWFGVDLARASSPRG